MGGPEESQGAPSMLIDIFIGLPIYQAGAEKEATKLHLFSFSFFYFSLLLGQSRLATKVAYMQKSWGGSR